MTQNDPANKGLKIPKFEDLQLVNAGSSESKTPPVPSPVIDKGYGIENAINLMRKLPEADMRVLATVIKETLESADIKVSNIIKDAEGKENRLEEQIKKLDSEIEDLEVMIAQRKETIHGLLYTLEETRQVKNNLALAIGSQGVEIPMQSQLKSKAGQEFHSRIDQGGEFSQKLTEEEGVSDNSADKSMLLDALFAKGQGDAIGES